MHLVGQFIQCLGTASRFLNNALGTATTTGTQHTAEVALQAHCIQHRVTASTFMGTSASITTYCIHLVGHCIHCMSIAFTFQDNAGGTATTAGTQHTGEAVLKAYSNHCLLTAPTRGHCILCHNIRKPTFGTLHWHCIHIQGHRTGHCNHCRDTATS